MHRHPRIAVWLAAPALLLCGAPLVPPCAAQPSSPLAADAPPPPSNLDLQRQIDELRALVGAQQREIESLRAGQTPAAAPAATTPPQPASGPPPVPLVVPSRETVRFYGFLRLDSIIDSGQASSTQSPFFIQSPGNPNVARTGNSVLSLHPRLTRMGFDFVAPPDTLRGGSVTGKIEMDWQNGAGLTAESRPLPRIRHAFVQIQRGASTWLLGQTWDVIAPLLPSPNDDTLMWNAGNVGDRRPQIRYTYAPANAPISAAVALGITSAVDGKDLDGNGIRDGEDSTLPNVQARVAVRGGRNAQAGLWGHYASERTTKPVATGKRGFESSGFGIDVQAPLAARLELRGEAWTGRNLSDFRGGVGQGVNATTGREIRSRGGWLEIGWQRSPGHRLALGYTRDDPKDADLPDGGRRENEAVYLHNRLRLTPSVDLGANYLFWTTKYRGLPTGTDHRVNTFLQHNF